MKTDLDEFADAARRVESLQLELERCRRELDTYQERLEQMETLYAHVADAIFVAELDGQIIDVNPAGCSLLGYSRAELLSLHPWDFVTSATREEILHLIQTMAPETPIAVQRTYRCKNGEQSLADLLMTRVNAAGRELLVVSCRDVTQRKRTVETLRASEQLARGLLAVRADVSAALSKPVHTSEMLRECAEALARHLETPFARIWTLNNRENVLELQASAGIYTCLDGAYGRIRLADSEIGWIAQEKKPHFTNDILNDPQVREKQWAQNCGFVSFAGYPLLVEDRAVGVMAIFARYPLSDATLDTLASVADAIAQGVERKRAEDELRRSEFYLAQGQRLAHSGSWSFTPDKICDYWSRELYEILGFDPAKGIPTITDYFKRVHPEDREIVEGTINRMIAQGEGCDLKKRIIRPDGSQRVIRCVGIPVRENGVVARFIGTLMDITDQEQLTQELRRREAYLAEAQRLSRTGSFGWNISTGELGWSKETFRIFEYDPSIKPTLQLVLQRVHPDDIPVVQQVIARAPDGKDFDVELRLLMPSGLVKHVHVVARAVNSESGNLEFIGAVMDVTEPKRAEEALQVARAELARVTRVTMMGELAASIAHEVNQPLAGVVTSANACLNWLANDPPNLHKARQATERILRDSTRAEEVLTRIRTLLKRTSPAKSLVSVNQILRDVLTLAGGELRQNHIEVSVELDSNLPAILGDSVQLQQVLLNLIMNANEAMADNASPRRRLLIKSQPERLDDQPGVTLKVIDNGAGFSHIDTRRLFEAFYTTKPDGMGMGLWISRSIVEDHGGRLIARSNSGPGATFQMILPVAAQAST